jgi:CRISPR/Cas system-associated protein Cas10 (large subunit of type III CRISPR-Cas system)
MASACSTRYTYAVEDGGNVFMLVLYEGLADAIAKRKQTDPRYNVVAVPDGRLCPVCGVPVEIRGSTLDGRLYGSCGDAFKLVRYMEDDDDA